MTFLQPWLLVALPLVGLPVIIHLINQRRFQTVPWAAMQFLLAAKALSRGYSRLRNWLIMMLRMLAVAAVILAVGRPLSRGWLALAGGGRPDSAIVVLDRSPSMQARDPDGGESKLDTGRRQLVESLRTLGPGRIMLATDAVRGPVEVQGPEAVTELATAGPVAAAADVPALLQTAYDFIRENGAGTTEIWICSDQRANDWRPDDGAWGGIRDAFAKLPQQVRFQLLSFPAAAAGNVAVRVGGVRLETVGRDHQLVVTVSVSRLEEGPQLMLPLTFEIGGVTTAVNIDLSGREAVLKNHVVPLERAAGTRGWGTVSIPADSDPADNDFFFAYDEPAPRRSLVLADDPAVRRVLELVAGTAPEKDAVSTVDALAPGSLAAAAWGDAAVLLWQAALPEGPAAETVQAFVERGGQVIFFPPEVPTSAAFAGVSWGEWTTHAAAVAPESWRTDQDLLANTLAGGALPLGELEVRRSCAVVGEAVPLASLPGALPLVARSSEVEGVIFCATTPAPRDSSLAAEGIVLYALVQRAIDRGRGVLGTARQLEAGPAAVALAAASPAWTRLAGPAGGASTEAGLHAGVFQAGDRLIAVNRPAAEDAAAAVGDDRTDALFRGLSFARITGRAGAADSIVQEIWRVCLTAMLLALIGEGLLSLPRRTAAAAPVAGFPPAGAAA
ncbi:MAG: BatA domain-containing protein [Pirellulales bacterium]